MKYNPLFHGSPRTWDTNRKPSKGGSSSAYYKEANRLYGVQADTADFMLGLGKQYLPDATSQFNTATSRYFDPSYEARMAGQAATDAQTAFGSQKAALTRDMARYGINPASGRWGMGSNQMAMAGAAGQAGAVNAARNYVQDKQFGAAKDYYSALVGMPSDAAAAAGNAANGFASIGANKANAAAQSATGWGQLVGMGMGAYGAFSAKDGGYVPRMANGGLFIASRYQAPPQPAGAPSTGMAGGIASGVSAGKALHSAFTGDAAKGVMRGMGNAATSVGNLAGNTGVAAQGLGMQASAAGVDLNSAIAAYGNAAKDATSAAEAAAAVEDYGTAASAANTAADLTAAGEGLAEGAGAMSGGLGAVATALPWVGAAMAIGSMFDLFADGGEVGDDYTQEKMLARANIYQALFGESYKGLPEQDAKVAQFVQQQLAMENPDSEPDISNGRKDMRAGGGVEGPGTTTSDSVPAMLSKGEYVINADAVDAVGKDTLDKINDVGLRKRQGKKGRG